ncbi:unnamed protein product [Phytomonas sp. Hart1]|nr:unnamed protein product [Phytomonas sp. Hart1]|eukprot:CCW66741.1 unnamed protein product [Phytomonas sp. isolate Hart1]
MMIGSTETPKDIEWDSFVQPNLAVMDTSTAHLLSQITFLHNEVERLENQLSSMRLKAMKEVKEVASHYDHIIEQKDSEITEWRARIGLRKTEVDLSKRCANLEKQLAVANAEKSTLIMEKNDIQSKVRKLESSMKMRTNELKETTRLSQEEHAMVSDQNTKLSQIVKKLSEENKKLTKDLTNLHQKSILRADKETGIELLITKDFEVQVCLPEKMEKECQVESSFFLIDPDSQSMHNLCHTLERKTQECDAFRAQFEDLKILQEDTLLTLDTTKKRLVDEIERRKMITNDAEKLSIQVQSMQQRNSFQAATERDLLEKNNILEDQKHQLRSDIVRLEHEHGTWEKLLKQYEKDMNELISNKNYSNQRLSLLANENENLQAEIQSLLARESQLAFSLKAKDGELQEVLIAYQNSVKENESILGNQQFLERELDSARATLASKEEGIMYLQEQLNALHRREQQLVLDLQAFEYENDQLHRKILHNDALLGKLENKCQEHQQLIHAKDLTIEELHQSLAEISKQIVIKENECLLLRRQCESFESDVIRLQTVVTTEAQRNQKIEESNARLVARDVLSSSNYYNDLSNQVTLLKQELDLRNKELENLKEILRIESEARQGLVKELQITKSNLSDISESKERLERIVLDQANTLSMLSK